MHSRLVRSRPFAAVLLLAGLLAAGCGRVAPTAELPTVEPTVAPAVEEPPTALPTEQPTQTPEPTATLIPAPPSATPEPEHTAAPTQALPSATPDPEPATLAPQPTVPVQGDAVALLQERCTACHTLDRVTQKSASFEEWVQIVAGMIGKGAALDEMEATLLVAYLAQTYGE